MIHHTFYVNVYQVSAAITRLLSVCSTRWCKPISINELNVARVALIACRHLKWLARRVPPRVYIAITCLHSNGWYIRRHHQSRHDRSFMFCEDGLDSIEHYVHCEAIQPLFPPIRRQEAQVRLQLPAFSCGAWMADIA